MRPRSIILFERLLWAALAIDLVNNLASWNRFAMTLAARGMTPTPPLLLAGCLASPVLGLILWYAVARRRSGVARWIVTGLVAVGAAGFVVTGLRGGAGSGAGSGQMTFAIGALAEALKVAAVGLLFTAAAKAWFSNGGRA